jgi:integrative and conjugative element protein (TIGR02256 family)
MEGSERYSQDLIAFKYNGAPTISISRAALQRMKQLAEDSAAVETGGILVGHNERNDIHVTAASEPGPNAERSPTHFLRDTAYCREFLATCYGESGADYVGEWHSHIVSLRRLSNGDINTLIRIFIDPDYDFTTFAVFLVLVEKEASQLLVYVAERGQDKSPKYKHIKIVELYRGEFPVS